ncbi:hypothetical protein HY224_02255 [Candidatus Uhrbacteria bacterium]|nr:hypothetical protein [Candidatus Uhrbacteria bacterium]
MSPINAIPYQVFVGNGFLALPLVIVGMVVFLAATAFLVWLVSGKQKITTFQAWDCGINLTPRMEITATGFSQSLIMMFKGVMKPSKQTEIEFHDQTTRYFGKVSVKLGIRDIYAMYLYNPLSLAVGKVSNKAKNVQSGVINAYLLYILVTLIGLLIWVSRT